MDVSIIIPFRNAENTLERCVRAVQSQTYNAGKIEILLVENGSTDQSPEIAARLAGVILLREMHPSIYAARNRGAAAARGAMLLFTEAKCLAEPDWVERHVTALIKTNASVSIGRLAPIKDSKLLSIFNSYENVRDAWNFGAAYWKQYFGRPTNLAIRRERFESHGPFEHALRGADSLLVQKIARELSCDEIIFCPEAVVKHLSLDGMPGCLRRRFRDSRIMRSLRSSHSAPIRRRDRVRLFWETIRTNRYGPIRAMALLFLLTLGVLAWKAGQWSASLRPTSETEI